MHILRKKDNFQKTEWKVRNACYLWIILVKIWKKNFYIFYIILLHFFPLLTLTEAMSSHTETFHIHVVNFKSYYVNISDCFIKQISHQTLYLSILEKDVFQYKFLKGWLALFNTYVTHPHYSAYYYYMKSWYTKYSIKTTW